MITVMTASIGLRLMRLILSAALKFLSQCEKRGISDVN